MFLYVFCIFSVCFKCVLYFFCRLFFYTCFEQFLYDFLSVVQDIVSEEAKFCRFEFMGYSLENSEFRIKLIEYFDNHLYRIKKENSEREFKFATKGCVYWRGNVNGA